MESKTYSTQDVDRVSQELFAELTAQRPDGVLATPGGVLGTVDPAFRDGLIRFLREYGAQSLRTLAQMVLDRLPG